APAASLRLQRLGASTPAITLAPRNVTGGFQRYLGRRWVYGVSAATMAGAMLWTGVNAFEVMRLDELAENLRRQTLDYQARYQQVTAQFPQAPTTADNLRQTVEMAGQIRSSLRTPESMFLVVSHALDALPQIPLTRIAWHYGGPAAALAAA